MVGEGVVAAEHLQAETLAEHDGVTVLIEQEQPETEPTESISKSIDIDEPAPTIMEAWPDLVAFLETDLADTETLEAALTITSQNSDTAPAPPTGVLPAAGTAAARANQLEVGATLRRDA
jgi:cytoskeletal protein RodZ